MSQKKQGLRHKWIAANRRLRELRMIAHGLLDTNHVVMAHIIPMRRCNLACAYCNEFDATSKPVPLETSPMADAAPRERSRLRPVHAAGPRSFTRTTTDRPRCETRSRVPSGSVRCAAVRPHWLKRSPLAVFLP